MCEWYCILRTTKGTWGGTVHSVPEVKCCRAEVSGVIEMLIFLLLSYCWVLGIEKKITLKLCLHILKDRPNEQINTS